MSGSIGCGCARVSNTDDEETRRKVALRTQDLEGRRRDLRLAIQRLSTRSVDPVDLRAVAELAYSLPAVREERGTAMFIKLITKGYERTSFMTTDPFLRSRACLWQEPLVGLVHVIAATVKAPTDVDGLDLQQVKVSFKAIVDVIWNDVLCLLIPGEQGDSRREVVGKFLTESLCHVPGLNEYMLPFKALGLAMHCWAYGSRQGRQRFGPLIPLALEHANYKVLERAVQSVGADVLACKFREWLVDPELIDEGLQREFRCMEPLLTAGCPPECPYKDHPQPTFTKVFINARTYEHVMTALARQKLRGSGRYLLDVYSLGDEILLEMGQKAKNSTKVFICMIESGLFNFIGEATCLFAEKEQSRLPLTLQYLAHVPYCPNPECPIPCTPEFLQACRTAFLQIYRPTMSRLQAAGTTRALIAIRIWSTFAKEVGALTEGAGSPKECGNPTCQFKSIPGKKLKVRLCSGCRAKAYCCVECQRTDWDFHKSQCRPLK